MSTPPKPPQHLDKDVERLVNLAKEAANRAIRFDERKKFDMAKRAYETAAKFLESASAKSGRKIFETKAAEYRARAQKIVSYSHVVKKKSNQSTFRLRGGRPDSTAAKMLEKNFGMSFDESGKLRNFKYTTEERYNQVGKLATHVLHDLLKTRFNFSRIPLPETAVSVWGSPGYAEAKVLCVIVHGAGAVRAGMWARKLLLNDSMASGTCLPWIENLMALKYGVLLLSPNDNVYHVRGVRARTLNMSLKYHRITHSCHSTLKNYEHPSYYSLLSSNVTKY